LIVANVDGSRRISLGAWADAMEATSREQPMAMSGGVRIMVINARWRVQPA
jgi:hypothetical protein